MVCLMQRVGMKTTRNSFVTPVQSKVDAVSVEAVPPVID